jgi:hypothetical protein
MPATAGVSLARRCGDCERAAPTQRGPINAHAIPTWHTSANVSLTRSARVRISPLKTAHGPPTGHPQGHPCPLGVPGSDTGECSGQHTTGGRRRSNGKGQAQSANGKGAAANGRGPFFQVRWRTCYLSGAAAARGGLKSKLPRNRIASESARARSGLSGPTAPVCGTKVCMVSHPRSVWRYSMPTTA